MRDSLNAVCLVMEPHWDYPCRLDRNPIDENFDVIFLVRQDKMMPIP